MRNLCTRDPDCVFYPVEPTPVKSVRGRRATVPDKSPVKKTRGRKAATKPAIKPIEPGE